MGANPDTARETFLFADLAGFTALTEAHGDEAAADLATAFCRRAGAMAETVGAEVVKTIGDALMVHAPRAADAIVLGLEILEREGSRGDFPHVRVGMHSGPASRRDGDWFGSSVNVAARVAGLAGSGEVLLTEATAGLAGPLEGIEYQRLGSRELRNVSEPVVLLRAVRLGRHAGPRHVDPVCQMTLDGEGIGTLAFEGHVFHFCSIECAGRFAEAPERYAR